MATIQIFGLKNCKDTLKAQRFFKERRIPFQFINLAEKAMSPGEFTSVSAAIGIENLLDTAGSQYKKRKLEYMDFDIAEELLEDPLLLITPVVRRGREATAGYRPGIWQQWLTE